MRGVKPRLIGVTEADFGTFPCCGIQSSSHLGRLEKSCWLRENTKFGVRAKALLAPSGKPAGYIEYLPGAYAWRGVKARGYMFVHCIWVHNRQNQRHGWGTMMVESCLEDARKTGMSGVAVMVRDGPWMAGRGLFLANGFAPVDAAPPDYELLAHRFDDKAPLPSFQKDYPRKLAQYGSGLTIIHSGQCPYIAKFVAEIVDSARKDYHLDPKLIRLQTPKQAQDAPTPYAVFSIILDGRLLADHQISRTRFRNIMDRL